MNCKKQHIKKDYLDCAADFELNDILFYYILCHLSSTCFTLAGCKTLNVQECTGYPYPIDLAVDGEWFLNACQGRRFFHTPILEASLPKRF